MRASRTPVLFQYMTYKFTAFTAALTAALSLTACGSGAGSDSDDNGATTASTAPAHALSDTVTVGNTLTISEVAVDTTGCTFSYPEELKRDAVKFQIVTTVDNQTGEDLTEALWSSDFTFTDADGLTVSTLDIASAEPPCSNDNARQFTDMNNGEKRRAAVTLEAPAGATTMTYSASTIPGAEPVTWDIAEEVAAMTVTRAGGSAGPNSTTEAGPAPAPGKWTDPRNPAPLRPETTASSPAASSTVPSSPILTSPVATSPCRENHPPGPTRTGPPAG